MQGEQQRHEGEGDRWRRSLENRHLEDHATHPLGRCDRSLQADVRSERQAAEDGFGHAELVEECKDLRHVQVHAVLGCVARLVGAAMAQQVQEDHAVAFPRQSASDAAIEVRVQQQAMEVHEDTLALAVHLVGETPAIVLEVPGDRHSTTLTQQLDCRPGPKGPNRYRSATPSHR